MSAGRLSRATALLAELGVIVLGVLIALGAESWWSERQERAYESEIREDMVAEFRENLGVLLADSAGNDAALSRIDRMLALSEAGLTGMSDSEFSDQFGAWIEWEGFDPAMGSVQALVSSGGLWAIEDRELRLRLSNWAGLLDEKRRFNLQAVDFQLREIFPVVARYQADLVWTPAERREYQQLLATHLLMTRLVLRNQTALRAEARRVLDYLGEDWSTVRPLTAEDRIPTG